MAQQPSPSQDSKVYHRCLIQAGNSYLFTLSIGARRVYHLGEIGGNTGGLQTVSAANGKKATELDGVKTTRFLRVKGITSISAARQANTNLSSWNGQLLLAQRTT
jgi:hypothetical protein